MIGPELSFTPRGLYIGGDWQEAAEGGRLASINPSTGEHLGEVPAATEADVDRAVRAARAAFETEWGRMPIRERAGYLERLADILHAHRDELGLMDCVDAGNALSGMVGDVDWTVDTLRYFAGLVTEVKGETSSYGPAAPELHPAPALRRGGEDQRLQPSVPLLRGEVRGGARGRQHGGGEGGGPGARSRACASRSCAKASCRRGW